MFFGNLVNDVSKRGLQLMLKQALGRYTKEISKDHIINPTWTTSGVKFETHTLELDDKAINSQVLEGTPLRLVCGQINGLKGEVSLSLTAPRNIEIENLDITIDVLGTLTKRSAASEAELAQQRARDANHGGADNHHARRGAHSSKENLYSSMLAGEVTREMIERDILAVDGGATDDAIDSGVNAVSSAVKTLICSINGHVNEIVVRLRVPPPGTEIVPGAPLPVRTTEVLLHLPKGIHILDETDQTAVGNSFSKRVKFGGLVVQVYTAQEQRHTTEDGVRTQHLSFNNTVCSGQMGSVENELTIAYHDTEAGGGGRSSWKVALNVHHMHMLMSPMQLSRLVRVANFFLRAPDVEDTAPSTTAAAPAAAAAAVAAQDASSPIQQQQQQQQGTPVSFAMSFSNLSCALLERESDEVGQCWRAFYEGRIADPHSGLTESYFGLKMEQLRGRIMKPPQRSTETHDDRNGPLFERYGGVHIQLGVRDIVVIERVGAARGGDGVERGDATRYVRPPSTLLSLRKIGRREGSQLAASIRTTCPLTPALAAEMGIRHTPKPGQPVNVARQEVAVYAFAAVEVTVDVETLRRALRFYRLVYSSVCPESLMPKDSFLDLADLDDLRAFGDDESPSVSPSRDRRRGSSTPPPNPPAAAASAAPAVNAEEYVLLRSVTVEAALLSLEIRFLRDHTPAPDFYGPLFQRLFKELNASAPPESVFLPRSLMFQISTMSVVCPKGDASDIIATIGLARCFLLDLRNARQQTELCCINFNGSGDGSGSGGGGGGTNGAGGAFPVDAMPTAAAGAAAHPSIRMRVDSDVAPMSRPVANYFTPKEDDASTAIKENALARKCGTSIGLRAHSATVALHQDDLLLLLFMVDQILECTNAALEEAARDLSLAAGLEVPASGGGGGIFYSAESDAAAIRASHVKTMVMGGDTSTSLQLQVGYAQIQLFAPRLAPSGAPVGDPIWMTRVPEERVTMRHDLAFHSYILELFGGDVFLMTLSANEVTSMTVNVRVDAIDLHEKLPSLPDVGPTFAPPPHAGCSPPWGGLAPLLRSYAQLHNRAHDAKASSARKALRVCITRLTDLAKRTQVMDGDVLIDRVTVPHQAAHDGDHWLFVLIAFFSDNPELKLKAARAAAAAASGSAAQGEGDAGSCSDDDATQDGASTVGDVVPLASTTSIVLTAIDTLLQYRPLSRDMMLVALCPRLVVDTGKILSGSPRVVMRISLESMSVLLHEEFRTDLLDYDAAQGASSVFGNSRKGVATDLELIGFVNVATIGSVDCSEPNVSIHLRDLDDKPMFVDVTNLKGEIAAANDSFYTLQVGISHFLGGADRVFIPQPHLLIGANGTEHVKVWPPVVRPVGPEVKVLVDNVEARIAELLGSKLRVVCPIVPPGRSTPQSTTPPPASPAAAAAAAPAHAQHKAFPAKARYFDSLRPDAGVPPPPPSLNHPTRGSRPGAPTTSQWQEDEDGFTFVDFAGAATARQNVHWTLMDNQTGLTAERDDGESLPADSVTPSQTPRARFELSQLFTDARHFTAKPSGPLRGGAAVKLRNCPPIAVEVVMHGCDFAVKLYGGTDLASTGVQVGGGGGADFATKTFQNDFFDHRSGADGDAPRNGRSTSELIIARLQGIFVQADIFDDGFNKAMQLLVTIRDVDVIDRIDGSPINSILMCTVPRESRDNDGHMFEMKWITIMTESIGGLRHPQEQMSMRLQPIAVALHRRAVDLLMKFFVAPDVETEPSTMFFNKLFIHPLTITLYVYPEVQNLGAAVGGDLYELANLVPSSLEGSRLATAPITLFNFAASELGAKLVEIILEQYGKLDLLLLVCRIEVVRTVAEGGQAVAELVLTPLDYYKRNKGLHTGIVHGLSNFTRRVSAETVRVVATATRSASAGLHCLTSPLQIPRSAPLSRGDQARTATEGLTRAASEVTNALVNTGAAVTLCFSSEGSIVKLPLAALLPINGLLRGVTQALIGVRNSIRPETRALEQNLFKK